MTFKYLTSHLRTRTEFILQPFIITFYRRHNSSQQCRHFASRVIVKESPTKVALREIRHQFCLEPKMKVPPYDHTCQIGDPILRGQSSLVDPGQIQSANVQKVITTLTDVMRGVGAVGCAAPQVGVAKQICVMEFTEKHKHRFDKEDLKVKEVEVFSRKVFINPVVSVIDPRVVILREGCLSVAGYDACVPRSYGVQITGYNERGQQVTWKVTGYSARIVQHEVDHLHGRLFVDIMDPSTFADREWSRWNLK